MPSVPSNVRSNPVFQACAAELGRLRLPFEVEVPRRGHPRILFKFRGEVLKKVFAGTPGDQRAPHRAVSDIRRIIQEAETRSQRTTGRPSVLQAETAPPPSRPEAWSRTMHNGTNPQAVRTIEFKGRALETFEREGQPFISLKPVVEGMGIDWDSQRKRLMRDPVLSETAVTTTGVAADGKRREMVAIPIAFLNGFLFGIDSYRVRDGVREAVLAYQRECYAALDNYWRQGAAINPRAFEGDGISPEMASRIGGIVKSVVTRQVADLGAGLELVLERLSKLGEQSFVHVEPAAMVTAFEVVENMAEVPSHKRFGGLSGQISAKLSKYCARHGFQIGLIDMRPGEKLTFPREAAMRWLTEGGRTEIWKLVASHEGRPGGQTVLQLHRPRGAAQVAGG